MGNAAQPRRRGQSTFRQDGGKIRARREMAGLSQAQLAKRIGCSQPYVAQMESSTRAQRISLKCAARLAREFGCSLDDLAATTCEDDDEDAA